jgi:ADP-ribose pyrophosphatase YjhB (NUDIX family)
MISILDQIKKLKALADTGLVYATDGYNRDRYEQILEISLELMAQVGSTSIDELKMAFAPVVEYPTVKTDVRGLVLSPNKKQVLMARESSDGKWTLPGGWADVGDTPREAVVKEIFEETGITAKPVALLAVFDKRMHNHPPQPYYIYKMVILCEAVSGELKSGFDMAGAGYFDIANLPELSEDRILKNQVELVYKKAVEGNFVAYFD